MPRLSISLLGPIQVQLNGKPVSGFASKKSQALLAYLVAEARPHHRDELTGLLWPDYPNKSASANFRSVLSNVRRVIDDHHALPPHLEITRQTVQFNYTSDTAFDIAVFDCLNDSSSFVQQNIPKLDAVVTHIDAPFLVGFSLSDCPAFEAWITQKRQHYDRQLVKAYRILINYYLVKNEFSRGLVHARRWLALDAWEEEAHQQIMRLLTLSGRRSEALAHFRQCQQVLKEEVGTEPTQQTIQLFEQIRANTLKAGLPDEIKSPGEVFRRSNASALRQTIQRPLAPLIGRNQELADLHVLLTNPNIRLLTVVGPGGIGKTHLALEAALAQQHEYQHGVALVSLAPIDSSTGLLSTIAEALAFSFYDSSPPQQQILDYLREKQMLLVMDNFEHLTSSASLIQSILEEAPNLKILVTSRIRLQVHGEQLYPLAGLVYPSDEAEQELVSQRRYESQFSALVLFEQQIRRVCPAYVLTNDSIAEMIRICRLVDGMPLGIILAAGWIELLTPGEIAEEIEHNFNFLQDEQHGLPTRHRNLQAVFEHTWSLLGNREQSILKKSSIFRGGFKDKAAQAIMGATLSDLLALVSKFLFYRAPDGRFTIHELLRQFAAQKLSQTPDEQSLIHLEHSAFYSTFLQDREDDLHGAHQHQTLMEIEEEGENIRAAWQWAAQNGQIEHLDRAITCLGTFYEWRARYHDGDLICQMVSKKLRRLDSADAIRLRVKVLTWQACFKRQLGQIERANGLINECLILQETSSLNEQESIRNEAAIHLELGNQAENLSEAQKCFRKALVAYRALNEANGIANALYLLGTKSDLKGTGDTKELLLAESLQLYRSFNNQHGVAAVLIAQGFNKVLLGEAIEGEELLNQSVAICREIGAHALLADGLGILGIGSLLKGEFAAAYIQLSQELERWRNLGNRSKVAGNMATLSHAIAHLGRFDESRDVAESARNLVRGLNEPWIMSYVLWNVGAAALVQGDLIEAEKTLSRSVEMHKDLGWTHRGHDVAITLGFADLKLARFDRVEQCLSQVLPQAIRTRSFITSVDSICLAACYLSAQNEPEIAMELYALAQRYPYVANSCWFRELTRPFIDEAEELLPSEAIAAAKERGRVKEYWAAEELLVTTFRLSAD